MRLILVRHGLTDGNLKRILEGPKSKLSEDGIKQVEKLAYQLRNERIEIILTSSFLRAKETAMIISKFHPKAKVKITKQLDEKNYNNYFGKKTDEVKKLKKPKGVESNYQIFNRAKKLLDNTFRKYPHKTLIFVGHDSINKSIVKNILHLSYDSNIKIKQDNASVSIFEITKDFNKIIRINSA